MTDPETQALLDVLVESVFQATIRLAIIGAKHNHSFDAKGHCVRFEECSDQDCILARGYESRQARA